MVYTIWRVQDSVWVGGLHAKRTENTYSGGRRRNKKTIRKLDPSETRTVLVDQETVFVKIWIWSEDSWENQEHRKRPEYYKNPAKNLEKFIESISQLPDVDKFYRKVIETAVFSDKSTETSESHGGTSSFGYTTSFAKFWARLHLFGEWTKESSAVSNAGLPRKVKNREKTPSSRFIIK